MGCGSELDLPPNREGLYIVQLQKSTSPKRNTSSASVCGILQSPWCYRCFRAPQRPTLSFLKRVDGATDALHPLMLGIQLASRGFLRSPQTHSL